MNLPEQYSLEAVGQAVKIDAACDEFESAWLAGQPVTIEQLLQSWPVEQHIQLLLELVPIELFHRSRCGEKPHINEYIERFPSVDSSWLLAQMGGTLADTQVLDLHSTDARKLDTCGSFASLVDASTSVSKLPHVPGYEILGELGRGTMGIVYLARQIALGRQVALKMVLAGGHASAETLARFKSEAAALARIPHPNIVQVFDCDEHEGRPYFSLELVEGGTLATKTAGVPQPPREAARLVETLARAVHYAHCAGIIHRDLKPANVLITRDGVCKLTDFGLAKLDQASHAATANTMLLGTPRYMAPEQAAGQTQVGPAADIYSLGVVLYELLTGRAPFQSASLKELLSDICHQEPIAPRLLKSTTPRDLETICLKCLEKSTHARYASAESLADDLQRFLSDRPIQARPIGKWEIFSRWCQRNPAVAGISATLVTVLLAVTIVSVIFANSYKAISDKAKLQASIAQQATQQSQQRSLETRMQFAHGLMNEARMLRRSGRPGQFAEAISKIKQARDNLQQLEEQAYPVPEQDWVVLRKEAASAFLVPDLKLSQTWPSHDTDFPFVSSNNERRLYIRFQEPNLRATVCRFGSDEPLYEIVPPEKQTLVSAEFSGDGKFLWTISSAATCVWELGQKAARQVISLPTAELAGLSYDGSVIARHVGPNRTEFHRVFNGELLAETDLGKLLFGSALHPSRPWAALQDRTSLIIYDFQNRQVVWSYRSLVQNANWSADGRWLATTRADGQIRLHASLTGEALIETFKQSDSSGVDVLPDSVNRALYTIDWSGSLRWYDANTGMLKMKLPAYYSARLKTASDGTLLALLNDGQRYMTYAPRRGRLLEFGVGSSQHAVLSHDGRWWASRHEAGLAFFHIPSGERLAILGSEYAPYPLAFSTDDRELLAYGRGLQRIGLNFQDGPDPELRVSIPELLFDSDTQDVWGCSHAMDVIAVPNYELGTILFKSSRSRREKWSAIMTPPQNDVRFAALSPDGKWLVAGSHVRGEVTVFSAQTGQLHKRLIQEGGIAKFSPDGRWLAVGKFAGGGQLYATRDWVLRGSLPGHSVAFSFDGQLIAVGTEMSTVALLATDTLRTVAEFEIQDQTRIIPVAFTPDGCGLLATSVEGRRALYFDLVGMRDELKELDMDWDWPALSPARAPASAPDTRPSHSIPRIVIQSEP